MRDLDSILADIDALAGWSKADRELVRGPEARALTVIMRPEETITAMLHVRHFHFSGGNFGVVAATPTRLIITGSYEDDGISLPFCDVTEISYRRWLIFERLRIVGPRTVVCSSARPDPKRFVDHVSALLSPLHATRVGG